MKYMFASDIHGSAYYCRKLLEAYRQSGAERLILLGDILYHGPRNDLPREYAPKEVIAMLNPMKQELLAVRGNCEAEVDQMVLDFPVLAGLCSACFKRPDLFCNTRPCVSSGQYAAVKAGDILVTDTPIF